jgi:basic amino acid/polyamine antiporter, APA family
LLKTTLPRHRPAELKRVLSLGAMVFYGLGTIVGAGIYVLIGKISGLAGSWTPLAFLIAAVISSFTGLSYAELVGRFPRSAGEAVYIENAFHQPWLTQLVGWSVVLTGIVSASTLIKGFAGYFISLFGGLEPVIIVISLSSICLLACSGVKQSVNLAVLITFLELGGLLIIVIVSTESLTSADNWQNWKEGLQAPSWSGIAAASFLAFYAFIGFEDMVNMAEEVTDAATALPKAIIIAIVCSGTIYFIIGLVAVIAVPSAELSASLSPLTTIVENSTWFPAFLMTCISLIAILNGAVVQVLMAPRVVYGITQNSTSLSFLAAINPRTQTPILATLLVTLLILVFSLWLPITQLAQLTSTVILCLFVLINCALVIIKMRGSYEGFEVYFWVPVSGIITSLLLLIAQFVI